MLTATLANAAPIVKMKKLEESFYPSSSQGERPEVEGRRANPTVAAILETCSVCFSVPFNRATERSRLTAAASQPALNPVLARPADVEGAASAHEAGQAIWVHETH